jgi:TRAP-type uncharacterized transport system substrate-binding protein
MPRHCRLTVVVSAFLLAATPVWADSLSDRRAAKEKADTVEVEVACGKLDKENCAVVVPEINTKTVSQNVRLKPLESKGSVESVDGLCDGDVQMAVVQADVLATRSAKPDCAGKVVALGRPLYPYEGFMVVRADTREDKFGDMVARVAPGKVLRVAAGGSGSGGELTLRNILSTTPGWKEIIDIAPTARQRRSTNCATIRSTRFSLWTGRSRRSCRKCAKQSTRRRSNASSNSSTCVPTTS